MTQKGRILIVVLLLFTMLACQRPSNILTEEIFTTTAKKQVEIAKKQAETVNLVNTFKIVDVSSIIFSQEEGNAGEIYWPTFQRRLITIPENQAVFDKMDVVAQAFDSEFRAAEKAKITPQLLELAKTEAQQLAELPEIADLEKATRLKTMRLVGESIPVEENISNIGSAPIGLLRGYSLALLSKGLLKEATGDKVAAESAMQSAIALGQHFAQDANYLHYVNGMSVVLSGCLSLRQFYERENNNEKKQAVEKIEKEVADQLGNLSQLTAVDPDKRNFNVIDGLGFLDEGVSVLATLATSENVAPGLRARAITSLFSGYTFRYEMVKRSGRPIDTAEYASPSDVRLQALTQVASSPNKALSQMANNAKQVLEKMKAQSNAERAKYWVEFTKPKG